MLCAHTHHTELAAIVLTPGRGTSGTSRMLFVCSVHSLRIYGVVILNRLINRLSSVRKVFLLEMSREV